MEREYQVCIWNDSHFFYKKNDIIKENTRGRLQGRRVHGQFPRSFSENLMENELPYLWLMFGEIKGQSTTVAAQDQAISTNHLKQHFEGKYC
jgi:hypothetical protein